MTKDEALRLAWGALSYINEGANNQGAHTGISWRCAANKSAEALNAIKAALEAKDEPVAFASHGVVNWIADKQFQHEAHLYSAPQRTWVGLTDEDMYFLFPHGKSVWVQETVKIIEAKLKEKNT